MDIGDVACSPPWVLLWWITGVVGREYVEDMGVWEEKGMGFSLTLALLMYIFWAEFEALNSAMALSVNMSCWLTHWFSESGYPFHLIRYWSLCPLPKHRESRTFLTSYSS